jgi:integrase
MVLKDMHKLPKAHEVKPGTFQAKGVDPETGKRKSYYGKTALEASMKAANSFGTKIHDESLYGYYANSYLPTIIHRSTNWRTQVGWAMDKFVIPEFGTMALTDIDRVSAQRFFNRISKNLAPSSVQKIKIVFSGVLNLAEDDELIPKNPLRRVRIQPVNDPCKRALTYAEARALIEASHDLAKPFIILGLCGLRLGEALGVTRSAIVDGTLFVTQQVLQPKGGCVVTKTLKTPQSQRMIPLPEGLVKMLLDCNQVSGIYVCSNTKGGYLTPNNVTREMAKAVENAGIGKVTPHELRHTFISLLENELEVPPAVVASLAGKKGEGITAGYSHSHKAQLLKAMTRHWDEIWKERAVAHIREA